MPPGVRRKGGWYDYDYLWDLVVLRFPEAFSVSRIASAIKGAKNYFPEEYRILTGQEVSLKDSFVLRWEERKLNNPRE